jgi:hypothetical protein
MSLPVIRGASAALYPFTMTLSFLTGMGEFQNGTQQRWAKRPGALVKFELPYAVIAQADKNTVKAAVTSAKGGFDTTLSLTLNGVTHTNLSLTSDVFNATEKSTLQYDAPLSVAQVLTQNLSPGTAGTAFPTLANGAMCQLPYTQMKRFQAIATVHESGPKQTYAEYGGGLASYPSDGLFSWKLEEEHLTDADLTTRMNHFIANFGRLVRFSFTDEDSTVYTKAHYQTDDMSIRFVGPND